MNLYFPQITTAWNDWVEAMNIGSETAEINIITRDFQGQEVWSNKSTLYAHSSYIIRVDSSAGDRDVSLQISSNQPLVGQRYTYSEMGIMVLPGASEYGKTVGKRFFLLSEVLPSTTDWFRFLNVGEANAKLKFVFRANDGRIITSRDFALGPFCWWDTDQQERRVRGDTNFELLSNQPLVVERHIYYQLRGQKMVAAYIYPSVDKTERPLERPPTENRWIPEVSTESH